MASKMLVPAMLAAWASLLLTDFSLASTSLCEEQLQIPWRKAVLEKKLPLGTAFDLKPDGTLGNGENNAVIDRPFFNVFQGGVWMLYTKESVEVFVQTSNQGYLANCEFVPFAGITINGDSASVTRILKGKSYTNRSSLSPEAIDLIRTAVGGRMEIITTVGTRFAVGEKTRNALKQLYSQSTD